MTITLSNDTTPGLLDIAELMDILAVTEPLTNVEFVPDAADGDKVSFHLPAGWNAGLKESAGTELTSAEMTVNGIEYQLTKDAILQATSSIGLTREYVQKTPGPLIADQLNYWMAHMPTRPMKLLANDTAGLAFTKQSVTPISNLALLETLLKSVEDLGVTAASEVMVDYKMHHDLRLTQFRLILPGYQDRIIESNGESHNWSVGIDFQNSLTAEAPLQIRGYLFSLPSTSGATTSHGNAGSYSRKGSPSEEDALDWTTAAFDKVATSLLHELDLVEQLTHVDIEGEVNHTMIDVFERYKVPAAAREAIIAELVESEDLSMYGVMCAITKAANQIHKLSPSIIKRLLEVGGDLPAAASGRCGNCHRLPVS